jgi:uncharacterized protein
MPNHPNEALVQDVGAAVISGNLTAAAHAMADDIVWHYFNPRLPDLAGEYQGAKEIQSLFEKLADKSDGTFTIEPVFLKAVGGELVVSHVRPKLVLGRQPVETDAVVIWRVQHGRIAEVWDIPALGSDKENKHTRAPGEKGQGGT